MATNFPTSLDSLTNPTASSTLNSPSHSAQHADANDAIEALEAKVGVNNSAVTTSLDYKVRNPELVGGGARPLLTGGAYIDGTNGLVLSGLTGNGATTPDSAALSITGDIDIKMELTMPDWTPSVSSEVLGKWQTGQRSYMLLVNTGGGMNFYNSADGTANNLFVSTAAMGFTDGDTGWIRATLDVDDGAGNKVVKFYKSTDGSSWSQVGTTVTAAGTTSIFDGTSALQIGIPFAFFPPTCTVHRVIIQSAYDTADNTTSLVFDADFEAEAADTLAFTEDSTNAATVSVTTTRYTYGAPGVQFSAIGTGSQITQNVAYFCPFVVTSPIDVDMLFFEITSGPASSVAVRAAIYETDNDFTPQGAAVVNFGEVTVPTSATGVFNKQITPVTLKPGAYSFVMVDNLTTMGYRSYRGGLSGATGNGSATPYVATMTAPSTVSTFPQTDLKPTARITGNNAPFWPGLFRWKAA